ncbi:MULTISPECIES: flagellar export chaperone FliS [Gammaproteobacteria]|jgi:flagellar protein FliS|uniref:flagellar export chaperone FliS n=1 Tax=Gammaproteobacteria TaxID=1236 RepID=UPI000C3AEEA9|nr:MULTISPECIES: flagellar export chaperone FliS [Gammaproteobacteria]MAD62673.1 flagellar export chaperone FliS [Haliea sp.]MAO67490.1 flagellar export chaperone FliS [Idiomarina sp.]MBF80327.1 flagellar export chaperone FliS [Idiomarina sp.]MBP57824.1 flagellar export chaperone FliS [Idiomarina sp.]|tara:strand:+ start:6974 stop:7396 length:423 start_codon:yes stop_codon:yes gene_type:complete
MNAKLKGYTKGSLETRVAGADPYQLVQMLMAGVLENLNYAKGAIQRKDLEKKSLYLSKAQAIVDSLRYSLDDSAGAEAVGNLRELYMYMSTRIADASIELDVDIIDEVARLMIDIKGAWDQIPVEQRDVAMNQMQQAAGA